MGNRPLRSGSKSGPQLKSLPDLPLMIFDLQAQHIYIFYISVMIQFFCMSHEGITHLNGSLESTRIADKRVFRLMSSSEPKKPTLVVSKNSSLEEIRQVASEESIERYNRRILYGKFAVIAVACLLAMTDAINPVTFGLDRWIVPQMIRWYGYDFVAAIMWLGLYDLMIGTVRFLLDRDKQKNAGSDKPPMFRSSQVYPLAAVAGASGVWKEVQQMNAPGRSFDWVDLGAYGLGYGTYILCSILLHRWARKKLLEENRIA